MPLYVVVVEADRPTFEVKGGKVVAVPFEADPFALAAVCTLGQLSGVDLDGPTLPSAIATLRPQRQAG